MELGHRVHQQYEVIHEPEVDLEKKPNIQLDNTACAGRPVSIEIKIAESWSLNELIAALHDQLVRQYLSEVNSCRGILLLCSMGKPKSW